MEPNEENAGRIIPIPGLFKNWFLDYASYVILERAVPELSDGLKPVQRRILHSMLQHGPGRQIGDTVEQNSPSITSEHLLSPPSTDQHLIISTVEFDNSIGENRGFVNATFQQKATDLFMQYDNISAFSNRLSIKKPLTSGEFGGKMNVFYELLFLRPAIYTS